MSLSRVLKQPRQWVYEDVLKEAVQIEFNLSEAASIPEADPLEPEMTCEADILISVANDMDVSILRAEAIESARQEVLLENSAFVERMQVAYQQYLNQLASEQAEAIRAIKEQAHHLALACTEQLIHSKINDEDQSLLLKLIDTECERLKDEHFTGIHLSRKLKPYEQALAAMLSQTQLKTTWVEGSVDTCIFEKDGTYYDVSLATKLENLKHLFMTR